MSAALLAGSAAAATAESEFQRASTKYYSLITSPQAGNESEWLACVEMFRRVARSYPKHNRAADSLFTVGVLHWNMHKRFGKQDNLYQAVQAYELLVASYPRSSLADDALYNVAIIYLEDMGDKSRAQPVLEKLRRDYPQTEMAQQAALLMRRLETGERVSEPRREAATEPTPIPTPVPTAEPTPREPQVSPEISESVPPPPPTRRLPAGSVGVDDIRYWSNPDYTRVSIYLSGPADFEHRMLRKDPVLGTPYRLYVDIPGAKLRGAFKREISVRDSLLQQVRSGQFTNEVARVVLDMDSVYDYQISSRANPPRIIIDVQGTQPEKTVLPTPTPTPAPVIEPAKPPAVAEIPKEVPKAVVTPRPPQDRVRMPSPVAPNNGNVRTIILDPGHGGEDPGAKGPRGTMEKDVVLDIAIKLRDYLTSYRNVRVIMTRDKDVFIPLPERSQIANQERGDLFVSLHANASPKRQASGVSTYIFDNAQDEYSKRLEQTENASILRGEKEEPDFLTMMFKSMTKNYFTNQSVELAVAVQKSMIGGLRTKYGSSVRDLGVRQAMFYVLWNTEMPAILVETSFITNRTEESRLRSDFYQYELARSIAHGLESYIEERFAMKLSKR